MTENGERIYRSPYPDVPIPDVSITELILDSARKWGDRLALVDGATGATMTYTQFAEAVERTAAGLHRWGLRKGDVAAIITPNRPEFAVAFHAVSRLGGAMTTMNPAFTAGEIGKQLQDSGARVVFTAPELAERVEQAPGGRIERIWTLDDTSSGGSFKSLSVAGDQAPPVSVDPTEDVVAIPYSSGTTGNPKGVMLTHRNMVANAAIFEPLESFEDGDRHIAVLPFFHIYGLNVILNESLWRGATVISFPRFDLDAYLQAVQQWRVRRLYLAPPMVLRLARDPVVDRYDLSSVKIAVSGAAPLPANVAAELEERLGCFVKQGYGLTELSPGITMHPDDPAKIPPETVGVLHPNTLVRLVDPVTGEDAPEGGPGEIWARGPQVMKGYLNRPDATADTITPDGWLRTGDIATVSADGNFSIVDRMKELIKYKGYQVPPAELEALLLKHPAVADVAVIPVADLEAGELPKAVVVRKPGTDPSAEELMEFVKGQVAPYKRIRLVGFADQIPKSASGKILRRVLVEEERAQAQPQA
ncbi:MAG: AMP-binding protein [Candidatus Dormibacteraeota bacterium]|nr:AMP-binding protein [Candidatus Dormibacteraeota bacterium]